MVANKGADVMLGAELELGAVGVVTGLEYRNMVAECGQFIGNGFSARRCWL